MKVISKTWYKAKCDPEGKVEYCIKPLSVRQQIYLFDQLSRDGKTETALSLEIARLSLCDIRGLEHKSVDGKPPVPFELEFEALDILGQSVMAVTNESLDHLLPELTLEIMSTLNKGVEAAGGKAVKVDDVDFSAGSSTRATRRARATRKRARTTARKPGSKSRGKR